MHFNFDMTSVLWAKLARTFDIKFSASDNMFCKATALSHAYSFSPFPSPLLPSPSLRSRPHIAASGSGECLSSPAGSDGARPPNAFWFIFGFLTGLL